MGADMRVLIDGIEYLSQMAAHPWTPKNVLDSIKEGIADRLEDLIAQRIEQALKARNPSAQLEAK